MENCLPPHPTHIHQKDLFCCAHVFNTNLKHLAPILAEVQIQEDGDTRHLTVDSELGKADSGQWTVDSGQWTVDIGMQLAHLYSYTEEVAKDLHTFTLNYSPIFSSQSNNQWTNTVQQ